MPLPRVEPSAFLPGPADRGFSSTIEFHSPQASHRPDHFEWTAPQAVQVKVMLLAMVKLCRMGRGGTTQNYRWCGRQATGRSPHCLFFEVSIEIASEARMQKVNRYSPQAVSSRPTPTPLATTM